jgi:hypothetical protein
MHRRASRAHHWVFSIPFQRLDFQSEQSPIWGPEERQSALSGSCPAWLRRPLRGFGGDGARCRPNRTKDPDETHRYPAGVAARRVAASGRHHRTSPSLIAGCQKGFCIFLADGHRPIGPNRNQLPRALFCRAPSASPRQCFRRHVPILVSRFHERSNVSKPRRRQQYGYHHCGAAAWSVRSLEIQGANPNAVRLVGPNAGNALKQSLDGHRSGLATVDEG